MKIIPILLLCISITHISANQKPVNGTSSSCPNPGPSDPFPTSVHRLRPADIDIIAAIGNSHTAAYAARSGFLFEDRDLSFLTGGNNPQSLASILRQYNQGLDGVSQSRNSMLAGAGDLGLNVAISGAVSGDAGGQAMEVIRKVKLVEGWRDKWKIVSIQMGANDLCISSCDNSVDSSPAAYRSNLEAAVSILSENLRRTLVLLLVPFDTTPLLDMTEKSFMCQNVHNFGCSCLFGERSAETRDKISKLQEDYRSQIQLLARDPRYDREDFAVEVIPTYQGIYPRTYKNGRLQPDIQFMAPDCLHFSLSLHSAIGAGIWNNLVEPAGKRSIFKVGDPLKCLSKERPFISTKRNSASEFNNIGIVFEVFHFLLLLL